MDTVPDLCEPGVTAIGNGVRLVDLSGIAEADSAAIALLLAFARTARGTRREIVFHGMSEGLLNLAHLYGVEHLLARPGT